MSPGVTAMFKQIVKDSRRDDDSLTLTLQRDLGDGPPILMATVVAVSVLVFLIVVATDGSAKLAFGSLAVMLFGGFLFLRLVFATTTLRFDAGTVQIQTEWFRFRWPSWEEPIVLRSRRRIYDRGRLHPPVSRPVFLREEKELVSGQFLSYYVARQRLYRYEIRVPLAARGGRGVICNAETEHRMNEFQAEIDRFWDEVPCVVAVTLADASCSDTISEPVESFKDYSFNRGEDFTGHGDEPPAPVEKPKPIKDERPIVTVRKKFRERRNEKSLTLISERGGPVLRTLGRTSLWLYRLLQLAFFVGVIGIFVYWEHFEPVFVDWSDRLSVEVFEILKNCDLPVKGDETVGDMMKRDLGDETISTLMKRELNADPLEFRIFFGLLFVLPLMVMFAGFADAALQIVRWPFWGRWKVRFRHSSRKPHLVTFDWRTDRRSGRSKRLSYAPFFLAIPATPKTHRMVTGQRLWDLNPGWYRPFQVVIITAEGSFPLPVAGPEEQRRVIDTLNEFIEQNERPI